MDRLQRAPWILVGLVLLGACAHEIDSPEPGLSGMSPSLVCVEQLETEVAVAGSGLSPVAVDTLTENPALRLPDLLLTRSGDLTGEPTDPFTLDLDEESGRVRWSSQASMAFDVFPELGLEPGLYDLSAANLAGQELEGPVATLVAGLAAVPRPTLEQAEPQIICVEQHDNTITLSGEGLLSVEGVLPEVHFGDLTLTADAVSDCFDVAGPTAAQSCQTVTVTIPAGALEPAVYPVSLTNPAPADCVSTDPIEIEVVPPPSLSTVEPDLVCTEQHENAFVLDGADFLVLADGTLPMVRVGAYEASASSAEGCSDLLGPAGGQACATLRFAMPVQAVPVGIHEVVVTNPPPADCHSEEEVDIEVVPPPAVDLVEPAILCSEQFENEVWLSGSDFLILADGTLPGITVGPWSGPASEVTGCTPLAGPAGGELCSGLMFSLPQGAAEPGIHPLVVTNPGPADCFSEEPVEIEIVAPPTVDSAVPELGCNAQQPITWTIEGSGFLSLAAGLPMVSIGDATVEADGVAGCAPLEGPVSGERCTTLTATLPAGTLDAGVQDVVVSNPIPADCSSLEAVQVETVGPPSVTVLLPGSTCVGTPVDTITASGAGFLRLADGSEPTVLFDGSPVTVEALTECATLAGPAGGERCTELTFDAPAGIFDAPGSFEVLLANPGDPGCESETAALFTVAEPPTLTEMAPASICEEALTTVTLQGSSFNPGSEVLVDGSSAPVSAVRFIDESTLEADIVGLAPGIYQVTVSNGEDCATVGSLSLTVVANPVVFFVDPPVLYAEIDTQATVFVSDVPSGIIEVFIEEEATGALTTIDAWSYDDANTITADIPAGSLALPEGSYAVHITSGLGCPGVLEGAFSIEADLTVALEAVDPSFGWQLEATPVDIRSPDPAERLPGEVGFADLPRVYLNPVSGGTATGLRSVAFRDETRLTAVVPAGLPPDEYDVIVVNPDGAIGVLLGAFRVTELAPPTIEGVSPNRADASAATPAVISGADFRAPEVDLACVLPGGGTSDLTVPVTSSSETQIDLTLPSDGLAEGTICVVRVTNDDGSFFDYSAISVGSPSGNLFPWSAGLPLVEARRAPAGVAGRATERARYAWAIGGDGGAVDSARVDVEVTPIDVFGEMLGWEMLPTELPAPRTLAAVQRVGDFIYLVGGNDGIGPVDTLWRARILDPLDTPGFDGLGITLGSGSELEGGTWSYRISALYAADDAINPGGESLASDPIVVRLPDLVDRIELALEWTPVDRAVGYRVYRSPVADAGSGSEVLVATTTAPGFVDDGAAAGSEVPLPEGSLGRFAEVGLLPGATAADAAREGAGVAFAVDPAQPDTLGYLYVIGGRDGTGTVRDTISAFPLDLADPAQAVGLPIDPGSGLEEGRWQLGVFTVDSGFHSVVGADETWLYAGPGRSAGGFTRATVAWQVLAGGDLAGSGNQDDLNPGRAGYAAVAANNFLYALGGARTSGPATDGGAETGISGPPGLAGWNALGAGGLTVARGLPGQAVESAVIFVIGGVDALGTPLSSTEQTSF